MIEFSGKATNSYHFSNPTFFVYLNKRNFYITPNSDNTFSFSKQGTITSCDSFLIEANMNYNPIEEINFHNFDTSNVTSMLQMFGFGFCLTSLDLSMFTTSKVTNMSSMFISCSKLVSLDLSNFNMTNVTKLGSMFYGCDSLKTIKIKDEASANKLISQIKTDLKKDATWDSETAIITIP